MQCPKCNGLMYTERFMDFDGTFDLWKCINCGALADPVIFKNQHLSLNFLKTAAAPIDETNETPRAKHKESKVRYAASSR